MDFKWFKHLNLALIINYNFDKSIIIDYFVFLLSAGKLIRHNRFVTTSEVLYWACTGYDFHSKSQMKKKLVSTYCI